MLTVHAIPALNDNYIWLIKHSVSKQVVIVDPGEAVPVVTAIEHYNVKPIAILITHQHYDHINGVNELVRHYSLPVFGQKISNNDVITNDLSAQAQLTLTPTFPAITILNTPGHTAAHLSYLIEGHLFCGDTLFAAGCGRLLDASARPLPERQRAKAAKQLHNSLNKLSALPDATRIYCAHEYTLNNLRFAAQVEPENITIQQRIAQVKDLRANNQNTLPSTIALEQATNPFLRCDQTQVKAAAETFSRSTLNSSLDVFSVLRKWKDNF